MALTIPVEMRAGDTLKFTDSLTNYQAPTWTLTYAFFSGEDSFQITSTDSNGDHAFNVPPATTKHWNSGEYRWQAFISDGTDRHTVASGRMRVLPDFTQSMSTQITHVERVMANLEKIIEKLSQEDVSSMAFNGRTYTKREIGDLLAWRDKYKNELAMLRRAEKIKQGKYKAGRVGVRF